MPDPIEPSTETPAPEAPPAVEAPTPEAPADDATPETPKAAPWADGDFDEARARTLIENLRAEVASLKTKRTAKTDADDRVSAAETRAADAERALYVERAIRKHSIAEDLVEFLTGTTEAEIDERAQKLAAATAGRAPEKPETPAPRSPEPSLTPGHGGEATTPFDAEAAAAAIRKRR